MQTVIRNLVFVILSTFLWLFISRSFFSIKSFWGWLFYLLTLVALISPALIINLVEDAKKLYQGKLKNSIYVISLFTLISIVFYLLQSDLLLSEMILDQKYADSRDSLELYKKISQIMFVLLLVAALIFSAVFQASFTALVADVKRSSYIQAAAISIVLLLGFLVALNYAVRVRPASVDMTTVSKFSISPEGKSIIKGVNQKVEITAFYPFFHELQKEVRLMLESLNQTNSLISYEFVDAIREKEIADKKKVATNGIIVFHSIDQNDTDLKRREKTRRVNVTTEADLKKMERDFISAILGVTQKRKKVYFTTGHGEYSYTGPFVAKLVSVLHDDLRQQSYDIEYLNPETGFPPAVPDDAETVAILGPTKNFSSAEQKALYKYFFERGGKIFLALNPETKADFSFLLKPFEIKYKKQVVASMQSDKRNKSIVFATNYSGHPIVNRFIQFPDKHRFSLWPGSGHFEEFKDRLALGKVYEKKFFALTNFRSWEDIIRNGVQDGKKEPSKAFNLAVAVGLPPVKPESAVDKVKPKPKQPGKNLRLVALGSASFLTNEFISIGRNHEIVSNSLKWLLEDERIMGMLPAKLQSKKVTLTPGQSDFVKYLLLFIWPFAIVASGLTYVRLRKKKVEPKSKAA